MDLVAYPGLVAPWIVVIGLIIVTAAIVQLGPGMGLGPTAAPLLALIDKDRPVAEARSTLAAFFALRFLVVLAGVAAAVLVPRGIA